jgi:hypothetical protein
MKGIWCILFLISSIDDSKLISQTDPFNKNRTKGAVFKYEKIDFDNLFFTLYQRNPDTYSGGNGYFKIESKMILFIDSIGKVKNIVFKVFVFESYYTSDNPYEKVVYDKNRIYDTVKSEIRRVIYSTNGLWLPKLIDNKQVGSSIMISMKFKNSDLFHYVDDPDLRTYFEEVCKEDISINDANRHLEENICRNYIDSLKKKDISWRVSINKYNNKLTLQTSKTFIQEKKFDLAKVYLKELERRFPGVKEVKELLTTCN